MKKFILFSAISFFLINLSSCYVNKTMTSQKEYADFMTRSNGMHKRNRSVKVLSVITKSGDTVLFNRNREYACRIYETHVSGFPLVKIRPEDVDSSFMDKDTLTMKYVWKGGVKYIYKEQNLSGYFCWKMDTLNVPISDIEQMKVRKPSAALTAGLVTFSGITALIVGIISSGALDMDFSTGFK